MQSCGRVVIEDDVEIGAGTTIDRASVGESRIGRGTKVDNLVQIGHSCTVGEDTLLQDLPWIPLTFEDNNRLDPNSAFGVPDPNLRTPYVQQWTFGIQQEIKGGFLSARQIFVVVRLSGALLEEERSRTEGVGDVV